MMADSQGSFPLIYETALKLNQKFSPIALFVGKLQFVVIWTAASSGSSPCAQRGAGRSQDLVDTCQSPAGDPLPEPCPYLWF